MQTIEWLMRAKSLKAGIIPVVFALTAPPHRRCVLVSGRIDGSVAQQGYGLCTGKPLTAGAATADGGETDTAVDEDDLISWAT